MTEQAQSKTTPNLSSMPGNLPLFRAGDTVKVHYKIIEGKKTRIQMYEGVVISLRGEGISKTFIVRRIGADNVGVERIFPMYSPNIEKLEVVKKGVVRRAKLYYLRKKKGRAATKIKGIVEEESTSTASSEA